MIKDNLNVNHNAVILARESRKLTQAELSNLLNLKQGTLSKIENGLLQVSENLLESFSQVLKYPREFFFEDITISHLNFNIYRKNKTLPPKELYFLNAIAHIYKLHYNKLLKTASPEETKIIHYDVENNTPEEIANFIRAYWNIGKGPIQNVVVLLENAGIFIKYLEVDTKGFSGVTTKTENGSYLIFINKNMPNDRIRFTLAHELGHIIMHSFPTNDMEKEADRFASEFLMPSTEIIKYLDNVNLSTLAQLKKFWKVSMASLLKKALDLDIITYRKYQSTWTIFGKFGYRLKEPYGEFIPFEETQFSEELIKIHMENFNYTIDEMCAFLKIDRTEFLKVYYPHNNDTDESYKTLDLVQW